LTISARCSSGLFSCGVLFMRTIATASSSALGSVAHLVKKSRQIATAFMLILAIHAAQRLAAFLALDREVIVDLGAADFTFDFWHLLNLSFRKRFSFTTPRTFLLNCHLCCQD
jgi:hypothetical protein